MSVGVPPRPVLWPAATVVAVLLGVRAFDLPPTERIRVAAFDVWQRLDPRAPDVALRPVVIVDIDEGSLRRVGQWPWPRDVLARLVDRIGASRPAAVGIDLLFPEPDRGSGDLELSSALARVRSVLAVAPVRATGAASAPSVPPLRIVGNDCRSALPAFDAAVRSVDVLDRAATSRGAIGLAGEPDGVVRRLPSAVRVGDAVVPALAVELVRVAAGAPAWTLACRAGGAEEADVGGFRIPMEPDGRLWIRYSRHEAWRFVSAADVLDGTAALPSSRIVLLGATAVGLGDVVATPVEPAMAAVEIHAQAVEAIVGEALLRRPPWSGAAEIALSAVAAAAAVSLALRLPARRSALALTLLALPCAISWAAFTRSWLIDPAWPAITAAASLPPALGARAVAEERARRRAREALEAERAKTLRLEGEMEAAREIQTSMLPAIDEVLAGRHGVEAAAVLVPARAVGGDLYDFVWLDDRRLFFLVGDVSGKGPPAALFMAMTKTLCRSLALRGGGVAEILTAADREMTAQNPALMFVTVTAAILDTAGGELEWASAGHEPPWLLAPGAVPRALAGEVGPPLGAAGGYPYPPARVAVAPGECILMLTDGVTDAESPDGERFGKDRLRAALSRGPLSLSPEAVVARLRDEVERHAAGAEPADDLTLLAVMRSRSAPISAP